MKKTDSPDVLVQSSISLLKANRRLMLFLIVREAILLFLFLFLYIGIFIVVAYKDMGRLLNIFSYDFWLEFSIFYGNHSRLTFIIFVLYAFLLYLTVVYFKTSLAYCVYNLITGKKATVSGALKNSAKNFLNILIWSILSAGGAILSRFLVRRYKNIILPGELTSASWKAVTFFVPSILAIKKVNPAIAIGESWNILKKTWGENVVAHIKITFSLLKYTLGAFGTTLLLLILTAILTIRFNALFVFVFIALILSLLCIIFLYFISLIKSTIYGILSTVLYVYASTGKASFGFDDDSLKSVFIPKLKDAGGKDE